MNSQQKHNQEASGKNPLALAIKREINNLKLRRALAQEKKNDLQSKVIGNFSDWEYRFSARKEISELVLEIDFLTSQIIAYENDDNKAKIIPDRLLLSRE